MKILNSGIVLICFFTSFLLAEDKPNVLFIAIESQGCFNGSLNFLSNQ